MIAAQDAAAPVQGPPPSVQEVTDAAVERGFWRTVLDTLEDPTVLEIGAITLLVLALVLAFWSLRRNLRKLQGRRLLVKYLDGVQAQSAGDPELAAKLLHEVVEVDPENLGARLAYGEALSQLGRSAEAHEQHVEAQESFGASGPGIEIALIAQLRAAGEVHEALERAKRALEKFSKNEAILRLAWEVRSEAGLYEAALEVGRKLSTRRSDPLLRAGLASVAVQAGMRCLARKDREGAERLFREALGYEPQHAEAQSGLELLSGDARAALLPRALASSDAPLALPVPDPSARARLVETAAPGGEAPGQRRLAAILSFFPDARCANCGASRVAAEAMCGACGSVGPAIFGEDGLDEELEDPALAIDEIEENDRWFTRLADALRRGDDSVHRALLEGGERAITPILRVAIASASNPELEALLVQLGRLHPGALLEARDTLAIESKRVLEGGRQLLERASGLPSRRSVDDVLAPVFLSLGEPARDAIAEVLAQPTKIADRGVRGLVLDWFVGLADLDAFQELGRRFAPVEIVRRLNHTPADALVPLFETMPAGRSFLRDAILLDPALDRPRALVRAALRAGSRDAKALVRWRELFAARGPGQRVLGHLVSALRTPERAHDASTLLEGFKHEALEQMVSTFADPDVEPAQLEVLARLIQSTGQDGAEALVRCFSSSPSEADDRVIEVIASIGKPAISKLESAYRGKVGWLGAIGAKRFLARHPRGCIARAIAAISHRSAHRALERLASWESEPDLASLLRELMRRHEEDHA